MFEVIISRYNESVTETLNFLVKEITHCAQELPSKSLEKLQFCIFLYNKDSSDLDNQQILQALKGDSSGNVSALLETLKDSSTFATIDTCDFKLQVLSLENIGREGQTYLHHIASNFRRYELDLEKDDVLVFVPASCTNPRKVTLTRRILRYAVESRNSAFVGQYFETTIDKQFHNLTMSTWQGTTVENSEKIPSGICAPSKFRPFGKWFSHFFPGVALHISCYSGVFAVSVRHVVENHSLEQYQALLEEVSTHSNPESGHYLERSWIAVFHPIPVLLCY